jgi:hypothetical protein
MATIATAIPMLLYWPRPNPAHLTYLVKSLVMSNNWRLRHLRHSAVEDLVRSRVSALRMTLGFEPGLQLMKMVRAIPCSFGSMRPPLDRAKSLACIINFRYDSATHLVR